VIDLGDGDSVKITFDANRLTAAWLEEGLQRDETNDPKSLAKALSYVMLGWDVTEDDGTTFPPTAENLALFSFPAQQAIMAQLMESALPTSAEGEVSPGTSSTPSTTSLEKQESLQNGRETSPSLALSESPSTG